MTPATDVIHDGCRPGDLAAVGDVRLSFHADRADGTDGSSRRADPLLRRVADPRWVA